MPSPGSWLAFSIEIKAQSHQHKSITQPSWLWTKLCKTGLAKHMQSCVEPRLQSGSLKVTSSAYGGCRSSQLSTAPWNRDEVEALLVYTPSAVFVERGKDAGMLSGIRHFRLLYVLLPSCRDRKEFDVLGSTINVLQVSFCLASGSGSSPLPHNSQAYPSFFVKQFLSKTRGSFNKLFHKKQQDEVSWAVVSVLG